MTKRTKIISSVLVLVVIFSVNVCYGQNTSPTPPTPNQTPSDPTPQATPVAPTPPTPIPSASSSQTSPISLDQALQMTFQQVSTYNQTQLNERTAAEDILQSKAALYPRITANPTVVFTSPSLANTNVNGTGHPASYLGANAITEYQGIVSASGEIDTSGRLRATIRRNQALLEAARSGTEVARRNLVSTLNETYLNLGLASLKKRAAEENLRVAVDFENLTKLLATGGEIPPIDAIRAGVQTSARRDELAQAELAEQQAADALRVFIGYDYSRPVSVTDLLMDVPAPTEIEQLTTNNAGNVRPEIAQIEAQQQAAEEDIKIAKAERRPQLTYILDGGFISDSLLPKPIYKTLGVRATIGVTIPLFDFGISKSKETQARIQAESLEQTKLFTQRMLAQEFRAAELQARSARDRIRLIGESIKNAEKVVEVSLLRYRAGEAQITEVTDAQIQLINQRTALYQAIFDYQIALTRLKLAVGK